MPRVKEALNQALNRRKPVTCVSQYTRKPVTCVSQYTRKPGLKPGLNQALPET